MTAITIGMPTYDDPAGLEWTLISLAHGHDLRSVEILVVDNHPIYETKHGKAQEDGATRTTRRLVEGLGGRYIPLVSPTGTAPPRNRIFQEASNDIVLVMDSHVQLQPNALDWITDYFERHETPDIVCGPRLGKALVPGEQRLQVSATHYADVWRSEMWGIWAQAWGCECGRFNFDASAVRRPGQAASIELIDGSLATVPGKREQPPLCAFHKIELGREVVTECPACGKSLPADLPYIQHEEPLTQLGFVRRGWKFDDVEPFPITGLGLGMFAMRRQDWPGFPAAMRGFGGGELHLHELVRSRGGQAICLPQAGWWHSFHRSGGKVPYPLTLWDKLRNYVIWRNELGYPLDPVYDHFVRELGKINQAQWDHLVADPIAHTQWPGHLATKKNKPSGRPQPSEGASVEDIYRWVLATKRDCVEHLPEVRKLASQCKHVTAFVKRREWDVAVAAAGVEQYRSCNAEDDPLRERLDLEDLPGNSLSADRQDTDLLILDTMHSAERITQELDHWHLHVRRWIAIRGTRTFAEVAEGGGKPGLLVGIRDWLKQHPQWKRVYQDDRQYGLTVLSCDPNERTIDRGVGYELSKLYKSLGINPPQNCTCRALSRKMDELGAAGCREQEDELVKAMKANATAYGWNDKIKAGWKALAVGVALKINPLDPIRSCLRIAIHRTEEDDKAWEARP
jgi:hypothetical protein